MLPKSLPRVCITVTHEFWWLCRYGVSEDGNSVCAFVHGFEPYLYVEAPTPDFGPDDCDVLRQHINVRGSCSAPCPFACMRADTSHSCSFAARQEILCTVIYGSRHQ